MTRTEEKMPSRRDQLAEKVMLMMLEKDSQWFRDPKPLAARAYAVADAMIEHEKDR